jgi:predicted kinase
MRNRRPCVIILSGIPCSGKSTFALGITNANPEESPITISRDKIRYEMDGSKYKHSSKNEKAVTVRFNNKLYNAADKGKNIIIDNTNCTEKYIDQFLTFFYAKYPNYHICIKFFDISFITALYRNLIRAWKTGKYIPLTVLIRMYKNYNKIKRLRYEHLFYE